LHTVQVHRSCLTALCTLCKVSDVRRSLHEQLQAAFAKSGMTLEQLLATAGLDIDTSSLSRKLSGKQLMRTDECEALAAALRVVVKTGARSAA